MLSALNRKPLFAEKSFGTSLLSVMPHRALAASVLVAVMAALIAPRRLTVAVVIVSIGKCGAANPARPTSLTSITCPSSVPIPETGLVFVLPLPVTTFIDPLESPAMITRT